MKPLGALWFCLVTVALATPPATNPVPPRTFQVHPLLFADPALAAEQARALVGPDGRVTLDAPNNRLAVIATVEEHAQIAGLIKQLSVPPRNIKIEVRILEAGQSGERGCGGTVRGAISVGAEVPFVDWFFDYGVRTGYLKSATRWEQVGTRLLVEPRVVGEGQTIQVKLVPEFSYLVAGKPFAVAFVNAATKVTVANGQEFHVGGAAKDQEFYRRFLVGGSCAGQTCSVDIVLKPTILP